MNTTTERVKWCVAHEAVGDGLYCHIWHGEAELEARVGVGEPILPESCRFVRAIISYEEEDG